jgi:hypothetical protein
MLKALLVFCLLVPAAFGETLLSGAIYFDSQNTLLEVQSSLKASDTDALGRLCKANHISDKVLKDVEVILLYWGPEGVEFRFASNPTTYWTYPKYVALKAPKPEASPTSTPSLSPAPNSTLPADLPSSLTSSSIDLPTPTQTPTPTPTPRTPAPFPTPKVRIASPQSQKDEDTERPPTPARGRHYRGRQAAKEDNQDVPQSAKVWHLVNGHLRWYDKRNWHEVRRALPVSAPPIAPIAQSGPNLPERQPAIPKEAATPAHAKP